MMASELERAEYHGTPDPAFVGLCDLAARVGLAVELEAGSDLFSVKPNQAKGDETYRYRNIVAVHVRSGEPALDAKLAVTARRGIADTLGTMAATARRRLEARLGEAR